MADLNLEKTNKLLGSINETLSTVTSKIETLANKLLGLDDQAGKLKNTTDQQAAAAEKAAIATEKHVEAIGKLGPKTNETKDELTNLSDSLKQVFDDTTKQIDSIIKTKTATVSLNDKIAVSVSAFALLKTVLGGAGDQYETFSSQVSNSIGSVTSSEDNLAGLTKSLNKLQTSGVPLLSSFAELGQTVVKQMAKFDAATRGVRNFENSLMALRGQYGGFKDLNKIEFVESLDDQMSKFNYTVGGVADATNTSIKEVQKYSQELMKLPGAFDTIIGRGKAFAEDTTMLEAGMRVARGTTGDFTDAIGAMTLEWKQFGTTSEKSLDYMSRIYEMSQNLGVSFKEFGELTGGVVKQFATFSSETKQTVELIAGLTGALKNTGLGIEPISAMIQKITGSIQGMTTSQKAFLSQQSGMAGGLQGAFQIDQMLASGDTRGVYRKMEEALKAQFGGRIMTLAEGAQSSNAASELYRQKEFLKQGPFGQMVGSDAEAYKLLEVFRKGSGPTPDMLQKGDSALKGALESDKGIQERQRDSLVTISNKVEELFRETQLQTAVLARSIAGQGDVANVIRKAEEQAKYRSVGAVKGTYSGGANHAKRMADIMETTMDMFNGSSQEIGGNLINSYMTQMAKLPDKMMHPDIVNAGSIENAAYAGGGGPKNLVLPKSSAGVRTPATTGPAGQPVVAQVALQDVTLTIKDNTGLIWKGKATVDSEPYQKSITGTTLHTD